MKFLIIIIIIIIIISLIISELGEEECVWDTGGKARSKETTGKTKT
jgi:uncharacterized membrane protein